MDKATMNLLLNSVAAAALVYANEAPWGPRLRGLDAYAAIVGIYIYLLFVGALQKADTYLRSRPAHSGPAHRPPRFDGPRSMNFLRVVLILAGLSLLYLAAPDATARAVGLESSLPPAAAFAAGIAFYLFLRATLLGKQWILGKRLAGVRATLRANRFLFPRDPRHSIPIAAAMVINPFAEEFLLRGVLIHLIGTRTGQWVPAIIAGLVVNVVLHAYQGRAAVPWHLAFYFAAVGLLLSGAGLWGAFGLHFAGDLVPLLEFPRNLATLRRLRAERSYSSSPSRRSGQ